MMRNDERGEDAADRIHAVAVKHGIALPESVVRDMVAYLHEGSAEASAGETDGPKGERLPHRIEWSHNSLVESAGSLLDRMERYAGLWEKAGKPQHGDTIRHWVAEVELLRTSLKEMVAAYDHAVFNVPSKRDHAAAETANKLLRYDATTDEQVSALCMQCGRTIFLGESIDCIDPDCPCAPLDPGHSE